MKAGVDLTRPPSAAWRLAREIENKSANRSSGVLVFDLPDQPSPAEPGGHIDAGNRWCFVFLVSFAVSSRRRCSVRSESS